MSRPVLSVCAERRNAALISEVAKLWIAHSDLVMDVTWGRGQWWKAYRPERFIAHDLELDGVDFRKLPEDDGTIDVVAFDPPYISPGGRETSTIPDFNRRYGLTTVARTVAANQADIVDGILECARVLRPGAEASPHRPPKRRPVGGRLLVKTMDYISGGHYRQGHRLVVDAADAAGLTQIDEWVHASGTGAQPKKNRDGSPRRQVHTRRAHTFLAVFQRVAR